MMRCRIFVFVSLLFLLSCNDKKQEERREEVTSLPPQYYYYPKANVYFDSANKNYLFIGNDGHTWQSAKQIPAVVQALMDKSVLIQNPADPVWKDNENHRLVYSAVLYATPNDTVQRKPIPKPVRKQAKPKVDSSEEKGERKGLGKFLDKIFGRDKKEKKKDKEEEQ